MTGEEVEGALRQVADYRADRNRKRFTLHRNDN
jgi:hypothetical protein